MSKSRFLHSNLITAEAMLAVSSLKLGVVTTALKEGTGSAVITPSGAFTGAVDLEYVIEIDGLGSGEIGSATFKWSDDGGSTWDATTVATAATDINLNNGVKIKWTGGAGGDFVLGDKWYFKGINLYNPGKMLDSDRDSRYRTADSDAVNTTTITLAAEAKIDALIIGDHNFTSTATLALWGDDAATFDSGVGGAAQVVETVTWASGKILHYLTTADRTKKYWQLRVQDADNADDYNEIGELYLGSYVELSRNYSNGFTEEPTFLMDSNKTSYGIGRDRFYNQQRVWSYTFERIVAADITLIRALITAVSSSSTGEFKPFWIHPDPADADEFHLVKLASLPITHRAGIYYDMTMQLTEVVKSI